VDGSVMGKWDAYWSTQPDNSRLRASTDVVGQIYGSGYSATAESDSSPAGVWWETLREYSGGLSPGSKVSWNSLSDSDQKIIENYYNNKVLAPAIDRWMEAAKQPSDGIGSDSSRQDANPFIGNIAQVDANGNTPSQWNSTGSENLQWKVTNPDSVASSLASKGFVSIDQVGTKAGDPSKAQATTQIGMMKAIDPSMPERYGIDDQYISDMEQRNAVLQAQRNAKHDSHNNMEGGIVAGLIGGMAGLGAAGAVSGAGGGGVAAGAASGAVGGAVTSAATGNNVLKGALVGGITGGFGAAVGDYASKFGGMGGSAIKAGARVLTGLAAGKDLKQSLIGGVGGFVSNEAGGGIPGQIAGTLTTGLINHALSDDSGSSSTSSGQQTQNAITTSTTASGSGFGAAVGSFSPVQAGGIDWFDSSRYWKG